MPTSYEEPDDWGETISPSVLHAYLMNKDRFNKLLTWYLRVGVRLNYRLSTYECLREMGLTMPRKKGSNGTVTDNGGNGGRFEGSRNEWKWVNINLTHEDVSLLEHSDSTFEYLATSVCSLASDGVGVTIKPADAGKSICCTLYRPDYPSMGTTIGISAFASNVRDALLVVLYKLDTYGGGDFSAFDLPSSVEATKPRFR